jgi:hypothetical protein
MTRASAGVTFPLILPSTVSLAKVTCSGGWAALEGAVSKCSRHLESDVAVSVQHGFSVENRLSVH